MSKPKIENALNQNNLEKKIARKLTAGELEKLNAEKVEQPELSPEEQLKNLGGEVETRQQEITKLNESIEGTKAKLNEAREKLGFPPTKEDPPSVFGNKDQREKLKAERGALEKQREELISQQEKERLIREEKEKILQEKLDEVFKEFEGLNPRDFESIFNSGKTPEGRNIESKSMGSLEPEVAQSLARAFKEGIKLLPKILEALPELLKKFDEDLTKEAIKRIEQKLKEEKDKLEVERKKEEKSKEPKMEVSKDEITFGEIKTGLNSVGEASIKNPKM